MLILNQKLEIVDRSTLESWIASNVDIAYDLETTGLDTRNDQVVGIGMSNSDEGFYVVHQNYETVVFPSMEEKMLVTHTSKQECIEILELLKPKRLRTWNGSFDTRFPIHYFNNTNLIDSIHIEGQMARHTIKEKDFNYYRLKDAGAEVYGLDAKKEQQDLDESIKANGGKPKEMYKADLHKMALYCIKDCRLTYDLCSHYVQLIEEAGQTEFFFEDEVMPLYREVTIPMELHGVPVDVEAMKKAQVDITADINRIEDEIQDELKDKLTLFRKWFLNKDYPAKRSGGFVQAYCKLNNLDLPMTKAGKYSLAQAALEALPEGKCKDYLCPEIVENAEGKKVKRYKVSYLDDEEVEKVQEYLWDNETEKDSRYMFSLASPHHIKKLFFDTLAEEPLSRTDKGNPQANDAFLDHMAKKYEWAEKIRTWRKLSKLKGTYIDRFLNKQQDGIFYPSWLQWGTVSGRYSGDLQQLPRPKEEGELNELVLHYNNMIRKFFIAGNGHNLADADYESLEPHVFAHVSGDDGIKNIFRNGHDFYSTIAIGAENMVDYSPDKSAENYLGLLDKPRRQSAKAYSLGVPYGMESFALSKTLNISQKEAQKIIDGYMSAYPELHKWMEDTKLLVTTVGEVRSQAGRVRHMHQAPKIWFAHGEEILDSLKLWQKYNGNPSKYKQMKYLRKQMKNFLDNGKNWQIQSLSASIVNRACIKIARKIKENNIPAYICCQVHDQIIVRFAEGYAENISAIMKECMENAFPLSVPLKAPVEIGTNFYDAH